MERSDLRGVFGEYDDKWFVDSVLYALERGVNMIDTARAYVESERLIGMALKEWKGELPFIATKVRVRGTGAGWGIPEPIEHDFPPGSIREDVETSVRLLGVDRIDLLQLQIPAQIWVKYLFRAILDGSNLNI